MGVRVLCVCLRKGFQDILGLRKTPTSPQCTTTHRRQQRPDSPWGRQTHKPPVHHALCPSPTRGKKAGRHDVGPGPRAWAKPLSVEDWRHEDTTGGKVFHFTEE